MVWIVLIVGFVAIVFCLAILIMPKFLRSIINFYLIGSRLYLAGLIRLVLGLILLALAIHTRLWGYVVIIGLLSAASGLSIFFFALRRTKKLFSRLKEQSNLILRLYAIGGLVIWGFLIYALLPLISAGFPR